MNEASRSASGAHPKPPSEASSSSSPDLAGPGAVLGEAAWAFSRDGGKEAPHHKSPLPSPSAGSLTLLVITSV